MNISQWFQRMKGRDKLAIIIFIALLSSFSVVYAASYIDNGGSQWNQWGSGWSTVSGDGYGGSFQWTLNSQSTAVESARWWDSYSGSCYIYANIPGSSNGTRSARYYINNGLDFYLANTIDQYAALGWVSVGGLTCATPSVYLYDSTGETANTTSVLYDAIRIDP